MIRPKNIIEYEKIDLKLGIKSSLPKVKSTIALLILLWESEPNCSELIYSTEFTSDGKIKINIDEIYKQKMFSLLNKICEIENISEDDIIVKINSNRLFEAQIESLIVAFELIWKLAKIEFVDTTKSYSAERTGGNRFKKKIIYTTNIDIINLLIETEKESYLKILLNWLDFDINIDMENENKLVKILTIFSESAIYKLNYKNGSITFNQNNIYNELVKNEDTVDISDDVEAKGPLRILSSYLKEDLHYYLKSGDGKNITLKTDKQQLIDYNKRVFTRFALSNHKFNFDSQQKKSSKDDHERLSGGTNIILYGVPGSGKSHTIEKKILDKDTVSQRIVFHPDYTYSDFVGQILPTVDENGQIKYEFIAGPFTNILEKAYNELQKKYALVIEEINRGNAPAIFGEIFQLLDRLSKSDNNDSFPIGTSAYEIMNENIAKIVYGESTHPIRIPSNLSIIATMNTSDQNVFTLDTAFQRRWEMRLVENKFNAEDSIIANKEILDTGVTWKNFCETINKYIIKSNSNFTSSEDKRLGKYFVNDSDLEDDQTNNQRRKFAEKVIKYLWDDAFKFNRDLLFENELTSLEDIVNQFIEKEGVDRFSIFTSNIFVKLTESNEQK